MPTYAFTVRRSIALSGALCLVLAVVSCGGRGTKAGEGGPVLAAYLGKTVGEAQAPIAVDAILPVNNGCQDALGLYLVKLAAEHPAWLRVRVYDMKGPDGRALMASKGIKCACVLVQGTTQFDLGEGLGKVLLEGPMDPLDVYHVLQHQVTAVASPPVVLPAPPDECSAPDAAERRKAGF